MHPQCPLFCRDKRHHISICSFSFESSGERPGATLAVASQFPPKHVRLEKILESLEAVPDKGWESGLHLRGRSVRAGQATFSFSPDKENLSVHLVCVFL